MKLYTDLCVGFLASIVILLAILGLVTLVRALAP